MSPLLLGGVIRGAGRTLVRSARQLASLSQTALKFGDTVTHPYALILTALVQENPTSTPQHLRAFFVALKPFCLPMLFMLETQESVPPSL